MIDIGAIVMDIFGPYGGGGLLLCVFIIFVIDALIFPTLPELFTVIAFMYDPSITWAAAILGVMVIGELAGMTSLYLVVEHIKVPKRVQVLATRYVDFLLLGDERLLLVNRVAPMVPFCGAFVSLIDGWCYRRALYYLIIGALFKYGLILAMSGFFYRYFSGPESQTFTLLFVFAIIILSFVYSMYRKRRMTEAGEEP